jgi:hypothetical protein
MHYQSKRSFLNSLKGLVAFAALGTFALSTGSALVERMQKHTAEDRLSFGAIETCDPASCSPSHFRLDRARLIDESGS